MIFPSKFIDSEKVGIDSVYFNAADGFKGKLQVDEGDNAHQWRIEMLTTALTPEGKRELAAFMVGLKGRANTCSISNLLPWLSDDNSFATIGEHSKGDDIINVDGVAGEIKAGDYFNFNNHTKVYIVVSGTTGNGQITIAPPLKEDVTTGTNILPATFTVRASTDTHTLDLDGKEYQSKKILSFVEVV